MNIYKQTIKVTGSTGDIIVRNVDSSGHTVRSMMKLLTKINDIKKLEAIYATE